MDFKVEEAKIIQAYDQVEQLPGIVNRPAEIWVPTSYVANKLGFNNYRKPSTSGIKALAKTVLKIGQLERLVFNIDPETKDIRFIDGRRKFSADFLLNFLEVPVSVYSFPKDQADELELSLNKLKTRIPLHDRIDYARRLNKEFRKIQGINEVNINREVASAMNTSTSVVKGYLQYLSAHKHLQEYDEQHKGFKLYSQIKAIAKAIPDKNKQLSFFKEYKQGFLENKQKPRRLANAQFNAFLGTVATQYKHQKKRGDLALTPQVIKSRDPNIVELSKNVLQHVNYLKVFFQIAQLDQNLSELLSENTPQWNFTNQLMQEYEQALLQAPERISTKIKNKLTFKEKLTFAEKEFKKLKNLQHKSIKTRPMLLAPFSSYIPIEEVSISTTNMRTSFDSQRLEDLAQDMRRNGQIKAGTVFESDAVLTKYEVIYGSSRRQAVEIADIPLYKAMIMKGITQPMRTMIEAVEDLFQPDTMYSRMVKLYTHFNIVKDMRARQNKEYTVEQFIAEKRHLASKKEIQDAFEVMKLDPFSLQLIQNRAVSKDVGISLDSLGQQEKVLAVINILSNKYDKRKSLEYIASIEQPTLFDTQDFFTFDKVISSFQDRMEISLEQLKHYVKKGRFNEDLIFLRHGNAYEQLNQMQNHFRI